MGADGGRTGAGLLVYALGLCSMLLVSTIYHRWVRTLRWRTIWRRADHATIFAAIAGTYTPLCLALFPTTAAIVTLAVVWSAALVGATIKFANWQRAEPAATAMYVTNGWAGVVLIPALAGAGLVLPTVLLVLGGVIYTVGAARVRPSLADPQAERLLLSRGLAPLYVDRGGGAPRGSVDRRCVRRCDNSTHAAVTVSSASCG